MIIKYSVLYYDFKCFICPWESLSKHTQDLPNVKLEGFISSVLNSSGVGRSIFSSRVLKREIRDTFQLR